MLLLSPDIDFNVSFQLLAPLCLAQQAALPAQQNSSSTGSSNRIATSACCKA
jgi:hypothetical protein